MGCGSSRDENGEAVSFERSEPLLDFKCKGFEHGGVQVAQCAVQGWRKTMEDVALVQFGVPPREDTLALGVFDGHSGGDAAQFAQEELIGHIKETDEWRRGDVSTGCINGFMAVDVAMRKCGVQSGTTAVLALISPEDIVVANCGDSRSVLSQVSNNKDVLMARLNALEEAFEKRGGLERILEKRRQFEHALRTRRGGRQLPMSVDHKPGRKAESRRILRSGGYLDETDPRNPRVVCDTLKMSIATSRALGDFDFKSNPSRLPEEQMVSPVPELYTRRRDPQDEFLILATDGVWDVMDNPGIVSFLQIQADCLARGEEIYGETGDTGETDSELLARSVLKRCLDLGSRDNMTIVLADLRRRRRKTRQKVPPPKLSPTTTALGDGAEDRGGVTAATGAPRLGDRSGTEAPPTAEAATLPAAVVGAATATAEAPAAAVAPEATADAGDKGDLGPSMRVVGGDSSVGGSAVSVSTSGGDPAVHGLVAAAAEAGVGTREALSQNSGGDGVGASDGSYLAGHVGGGRDGSSETRPGESAGVSGLTAGGGGVNSTSKVAVESGGIAVSGVVGVSGKTSSGGAAAVVEGDGVVEALTARETGGLLRPPEAVER